MAIWTQLFWTVHIQWVIFYKYSQKSGFQWIMSWQMQFVIHRIANWLAFPTYAAIYQGEECSLISELKCDIYMIARDV